MAYSAPYTNLNYDINDHSAYKVAKIADTLQTVESVEYPYRVDHRTRRLCIAALVCSWIVGIAVTGLGIFVLYLVNSNRAQGQIWMIPHIAAECVSLGINLLTTMLIEGTGYIHTVSLRWALLEEGKLTFNSNLRLLSNSRRSRPNKWYSNMFVLISIIFAYSMSSRLYTHTHEATSIWTIFGTQEDQVTVGGIPILLLGLCMISLTAMSTWALKSTRVPSWSSCPLNTALVARNTGMIHQQPGRCMFSVHDAAKHTGVPIYPQGRQRSAWAAHKEVKWILALIWGLVLLGFIWALVVRHLIIAVNPDISPTGSWSLLPDSNTTQFSFETPINSPITSWLALVVLSTIFQAPLTFGLHCAELQMNLSRDEAFWRNASTAKGCRLDSYDSAKRAFFSWQSLTLNFFKSVLHWIFGFAVTVLNGRIYFGFVQLVYLVVLSFIFALFVTYVSGRRPRGHQPATYGHLQTLVDLIDDWSKTLFWGHKSDGYQVCHAGTAGHPLMHVKNTPYR